MRVIYSVGSRLGGAGIGTAAYHAVQGIARGGHLLRVLASSAAPGLVPREQIRTMGLLGRLLQKVASLEASGALYAWIDPLYDHWAARHLEPCHIFHGWNHHCLASLRRTKALGAITVVERASSHPLTQKRLLEEEYRAWGFPSLRVPDALVQRSLLELAEADYVLVPSEFAYGSFVEQGFPEAKLQLLSFGVDTERYRPAPEPEGPFRALFVGQLSLRKGVPYLLGAWRELGLKDAELILAGALSPQVATLLRRESPLPGVSLLGPVAHLGSLYQRASVFVFPSLEEGSALVTYEAMACGLPSIVTPNAGSLVRDGIEGYVIPPGDVESLKERLLLLYQDPERRRGMGQRARQRVEAYTWQHHGEELVACYQRLLGATILPQPGRERAGELP